MRLRVAHSKHLARFLAKRFHRARGRQPRVAGAKSTEWGERVVSPLASGAKRIEGGERVVSPPAGGRQLRSGGAIDGMAGRAPSAFGFPNERV